MKYHINNETEAVEFARKLSHNLKGGDVVAISGELGAGKSVFARALMRALGVKDEALPSPTFSIIQEYEGSDWRVVHMDWYRLEEQDELDAIGVREYFQPPWICLIEWPERGEGLLPDESIRISLEYVPGHPDQRVIVVHASCSEPC